MSMKLTQYIPRAGQTLLDADLWIRQVTKILTGAFAPTDQGATASFLWNSSAQNPTVPVSSTKPAGIIVLSAVLHGAGDSKVVSGCDITWSWVPSASGGAILVNAVSGLTEAVDYDVTVWIVGSN